MLKFDMTDSSDMFEMSRSPQQPDPLDETPTFPEPASHEQDEGKPDWGLNSRIVEEDLNHQAEADDLGIQSTARDISTVKGQRKRGSNGPISRAIKNGRTSVPTLSADEAIKQAVDLVKKIGTDRVRELCDVIDCVSQ
jgi:hypothetical protein